MGRKQKKAENQLELERTTALVAISRKSQFCGNLGTVVVKIWKVNPDGSKVDKANRFKALLSLSGSCERETRIPEGLYQMEAKTSG